MEVMVMALKEPLGVTKNSTVLIGDKSKSSSVFFLLGHLWSYKAWAVTNANKSAKGTLCMGGLITPILLACGVPPAQVDRYQAHEADAVIGLRVD